MGRIIGLVRFAHFEFFVQVDLQTFLSLTDADLKELGITTFGPRRKMLLAIQGNKKDIWQLQLLK
jgi:protein bicaudal C